MTCTVILGCWRRRAICAWKSPSFSGVWLQGNGFQEMSLHGFGAGARATASAVLGDLIEIARHPKPPRHDDPSLRPGETAPIETLTTRYFVRLTASDEVALRPAREPLHLLGAEFHPAEPLESGVEQVALTSPLNEGDFQAHIARLRQQPNATVQVIRMLGW